MIQNTMFNPGSLPLQASSLAKSAASPSDSLQQFGTYLQEAMQSVSAQEKNANLMSDKMIMGQVSVDQTMISAQQALLSVQLTTQVRNKVVEAYQEIMRTQM